MKRLRLIPLLMFLFIYSAFAQDAENCSDHPMFGRMPGYFIAECFTQPDKGQMLTGDDKEITIEGKMTYFYYAPREDNMQLPVFSQIIKHYENAIKKYEVEKIFSDSNHATWKIIPDDKKVVWLMINNWESGNGKGHYDLTIVEAN